MNTVFQKRIQDLEQTKNTPGIVLAYLSEISHSEDIYKHFKTKIQMQFNLPIEEIHLNGLDTDPAVFHAELATIPMFEGIRFLWVRHADSLIKKIETNSTILPYFKRDLNNLPETTFLLLQMDDKKLPVALKEIEEKAFIIEQEKLKEKDLPDLIRFKIQQMGFEIQNDAIYELTRRHQSSPGLINASLHRLFLYCLNEKKIEIKDIDEISFDMEGNLTFQIIDLIAERKIIPAIKGFLNHKISDGNLFFSMLSKTFTEYIRYYYLRKSETPIKEIHERMSWNTNHTYLIRKNEDKMNKISSVYRLNEIRLILQQLIKLDKYLKENNMVTYQKSVILIFIASLQNPLQ